jgi:hypothetical protein
MGLTAAAFRALAEKADADFGYPATRDEFASAVIAERERIARALLALEMLEEYHAIYGGSSMPIIANLLARLDAASKEGTHGQG